MFLDGGTPDLVHNTDIMGELQKLATAADFAWIASAADRVAESSAACAETCCVPSSLDAFATALEK